MRIVVLVSLLAFGAVAADHVLIHPFEGSTPSGRESKAKQTVSLPDGSNGRMLELQGSYSKFSWKNPKGKNAQEIYSAYEREMTQAGFKKVWACTGKDCGSPVDAKPMGKIPADSEARYYLGQLVRRELGDAYGALQVTAATSTLLVLEVSQTPEQKDAVAKEAAAAAQKVTATSLGDALSKDGHVALGDILYRPGEVALRPEAQNVVKEIATMLKNNPGLKLYVVGHTDSEGEYSTNLSVSKKRATWLVKELTRQGVPGSRLRADGVGPLAPVAPNDTEQGRSRNRRVELVKQ